jgi:Zn-dependent M28 family amino/carboxypeptidase
MRASVLVALALAGCSAPIAGGGGTPAWVSDTASYSSPAMQPPSKIAERYGDVAKRIIEYARADRGAYAKLAYLADRIGHRLSGSAALDRAIEWAVKTLKDEGFDGRAEKVMVPHWVRGVEEASIVTPVERPLKLLGLGGSVATPKGGVTAPVLVVNSFDELEAKAAQVKGAIVVFNHAMPPYSTEKGSGYGEAAQYRTRGASRAAKHGAVAVLVRSVTAHSLRTPHTGAMRYDDKQPKIPAAAITVEDAELVARLAANGTVTVRLRLESQQKPDAPSANVIAELRGKDKPDEIVVIGGHIDSWDVGQGAHDDGAGCVMMMQVLSTLKALGLQPRRTIRVVLWTNEENGLEGAKAYAKDHAAELPKHVLALEADSGGFSPRGFTVEKKPEDPKVVARIAEIAALLAPLGPMRVIAGGSGADLTPLIPAGVTGVGLMTDGRTYFDTHHTEADTLDKVDPQELADGVAAVAVLAYVVADLE